ncbi:MAG: leucine-rich repeat domain-containing protein [Dysgonamonadaceae bacterium]|nr:leucine-rich repeat domain-containing protein [Dysgonamonadaceae bacterium]
MKRIFLTVVALFLLSATGFAQSGTAGPLTWDISDGTLTISGTGAMPDYTYDYEAPWYDYRNLITTVVIVDGVTSIGQWAFQYYSKLTSVTIPNSVTSIGESAFHSCIVLTSVTIPNSVTRIRELTFNGCSSLTAVTIGNNVISIGTRAFYGCSSLTNITIPGSVYSIGDGAFNGCSRLTAIDVSENNTAYASANGVLSNKAKSYLIRYPEGKQDASYNIPHSVTNIREEAFYDCIGLTSVTIPNSVISIGDKAFAGCSGLTSVSIPNSVTSIGGNTFSVCSSLTSVTIPESVTSIGNYAFSWCEGLTSVTNLNSTPQNINKNVFDGIVLSNITLYVLTGSVEKYKAAAIWKDFKEIKAYIPSAIESPAAKSSINIYPNPFTETFKVGGIPASTEVIVSDLSGRTVLRQNITVDESVAVGNLPKGIYIVNIEGKTVKGVKR